jgi:cell division protein FtsA
MPANCVAGVDIGTSEIKMVVAEEASPGRLVPRLFLREPSAGVRKGAVVEPGELVPPLTKLFHEARGMAKGILRNLYVNIGTTQVNVQPSRGIVAVSRADSEIYQDDVERVIKAAQALTLGPNRTLIHNIVREFIVDGTADIVDPLGLSGSRLEVQSLVIDAFALHVKNVSRAIEMAGGEMRELIFNPLAAARAALSKRRKDLGVVLIDLGAGTTGVSVYEENKLVGVAQLPLGGSNISNDIAIGLKVPVSEAEAIKMRYGHAIAKQVGARELVDVRQTSPESPRTVTRRFVAEIIESRMTEIFELVDSELQTLGKSGRLAEGVVIVGGGAKLPGIADLARKELKLSSEVVTNLGDQWSLETAGFAQDLNSPDFAVALGLALSSVQSEEGPVRGAFAAPFKMGKGFLKYFLP